MPSSAMSQAAWLAGAGAPVIEALHRRVEHGVFGYCVESAELRATIADRLAALYGWRVGPGCRSVSITFGPQSQVDAGFVIEAGGIPVLGWLDGLSEGELRYEELCRVAMAGGVEAIEPAVVVAHPQVAAAVHAKTVMCEAGIKEARPQTPALPRCPASRKAKRDVIHAGAVGEARIN